MLPKSANLFSVLRVKLIQGASNAIVCKPANMRWISKRTASIQHKVNEAVFNFDFGRDINKFWHVVHCVLSLPKKRDPFSLEDVTRCKGLQALTLVNKFRSSNFRVNA